MESKYGTSNLLENQAHSFLMGSYLLELNNSSSEGEFNSDSDSDSLVECNNSGYECCGRKEGRNNRKEYHSTSKARKVRSEIVVLYYNILKVS